MERPSRSYLGLICLRGGYLEVDILRGVELLQDGASEEGVCEASEAHCAIIDLLEEVVGHRREDSAVEHEEDHVLQAGVELEDVVGQGVESGELGEEVEEDGQAQNYPGTVQH